MKLKKQNLISKSKQKLDVNIDTGYFILIYQHIQTYY